MTALAQVKELVAQAKRVADGVAATPSWRAEPSEWVELVDACQQLINVTSAIQDSSITRAAAIERVCLPYAAAAGSAVDVPDPLEPIDAEGDAWVWRHHQPGFVTLDAPALLAPALGCALSHASVRIDKAVSMAGARIPVADQRLLMSDPVPAERAASGLGALHTAMASGALDVYRAGVIAGELLAADADVCVRVLDALGPELATRTGSGLRRRVRALLAGIDPQSLVERARRARAECGLRRWQAEPGVDTWSAVLPVEAAYPAWLALDELARRYVHEGTSPRLEQARGQALTDLITGQATVSVGVHLAVPATHSAPRATATAPDGAAAGSEPMPSMTPARLAAVRAPGRVEPLWVHPTWLSTLPVTATMTCDPSTGALLDHDDLHTHRYRPTPQLRRFVERRDSVCRFPGCHIPATRCDLDHLIPWPEGPTEAANLIALCRRHHRLKQRPGWSVRLNPDGSLHWTTPTGSQLLSTPVDYLHPTPDPDQLPVLLSAIEELLLYVLDSPTRMPAPRTTPRHHRPPRPLVDLELIAPPKPAPSQDLPPF